MKERKKIVHQRLKILDRKKKLDTSFTFQDLYFQYYRQILNDQKEDEGEEKLTFRLKVDPFKSNFKCILIFEGSKLFITIIRMFF